MLKKHALIITIIYSTILAVLSLIHISGLKEINYSNTDKIFHFIAYSALAWFWFKALYYKFNKTFNASLLIAAIISIIFGIIIEVLQGTLTSTRVAENNDILANTLGVCLTIAILFLFKKAEVKK
ncbi:VanZ family protein [Lacinutrix iliipiscaria]|uniref:VanZ family protein n=1 Tax=Lacinutrix iliipiscaria TaxID=1230532 RepID=A0ABW5WK41_9FLAO